MLEMRAITADEFLPWARAESRAHSNRLADDPRRVVAPLRSNPVHRRI